MILSHMGELAGVALPRFRCSKCRDAAAEVMWLGLSLQISTRQGEKWSDGDLYLCRSCASDLCLGILRDVAELEQERGYHEPMEALNRLSQAFKAMA